ncbi:MAG: hypothetical protein ACK5JM_09285 [Rhodoblastus sp.]
MNLRLSRKQDNAGRNGQCSPRADVLLSLAAFLALAGLYALGHSYTGIQGDAKIYMGRALADVDPAGVGRDFMFVLDGQSHFSLFRPFARWLTARYSLAGASLALATFACLVWFAGAFAFVRRAAPAHAMLVAAIVFACPAGYGPFQLLAFGEPLAVPRPYAEAFTRLALAAFLAGRLVASFVLLAVAAVLHPIMALAGVAVIGLVLCMEDRRWLLVMGACAIALVAAIAFDAPIAGRAKIMVDQQWLALLFGRTAYLFPHLAGSGDWVLPIVQAVTIVLAAARAEGRLKRLLHAGLAAGALGLAVGWIAGVFAPSLLVLQLQPWRIWWLTGFLAAFSLGYCALRLGAGSALDKIAAVMLTLAWVMSDQGFFALLPAAIAFLAVGAHVMRDLAITEKIARNAWIACAVIVIAPTAVLLGVWANYPGTPNYRPMFTKQFMAVVGNCILFGLVAYAVLGGPQWFARLPQRAARAGALAGGVLVAALGGILWRNPDSYEHALAQARVQDDLAQMTPRDGEILWLQGSLEPWVWLRRPHWLGDIQGAGVVFSRELAHLYNERAQALVTAGLDNGALVRRYNDLPKYEIAKLDPAGLAQICRRADAPAYIVAPLAPGGAPDPALKAKLWTPPALRVETSAAAGKVEKTLYERYAVVDCAKLR